MKAWQPRGHPAARLAETWAEAGTPLSRKEKGHFGLAVQIPIHPACRSHNVHISDHVKVNLTSISKASCKRNVLTLRF